MYSSALEDWYNKDNEKEKLTIRQSHKRKITILDKLLRLTYNWRLAHGIYTINELQAGGHCGLCGAWMPNVVVPKDWPWDMCDKHKGV